VSAAICDAGGVQITTLGPLAVDGRPVRGDRLATVIRELVDARGRPVSVAALAESVWDGDPPENVAGAVQALVSRVRRLGLPVHATPTGYALPPAEVEIDAVAAEEELRRGRAALAAADLTRAATCLDAARRRFPAVPDLADPPTHRLFADVVTTRAEAALATGAVADDADLRRLVERTPPHEPAAALLLRSLAVQGREAEALELAAQVRAELADRYGADPSPVLAAAHLALLRGAAETGPDISSRNSLPPAWRRSATRLVGRDCDVAAIAAELATAPLVTLVATGGAGKTRLAAEVARRAVERGRAVRVVELAGLRSPEEVAPAVLAAVEPTRADTPPVRGEVGARLREAARQFEGIVVVDNCEHLLAPAADVVAELLGAAGPAVAVLATSRAPLGLPGEVVHRVPGLGDAEAVELLTAQARRGGATLAYDPQRTLELCHRLDNLPLALELAAARLRHMPLDDVLTGLADRFALLDDALRGLPERHASLWAMVDWSRDLLSTEDRQLLERAAVIPAPFLADTAAAAAGRPDVRLGLATLVEQSLLTLEQSETGPARYRMLETVREYGEARLASGGGRDAPMAGVVAWAARHAVVLAEDFLGAGQVVALARCAADQETLVAALRWAVADGDDPAATDIAAALFRLWTIRGRHHDVVALAEVVLRVGDPAARRESATIRGRASGRPLPNADRLMWTAVVVAINSGVIGLGPRRLDALARRVVRRLLAERPEEVSERATILATALAAFESSDPKHHLEVANGLLGHTDPLVQGFGYLARSLIQENAGRAAGSGDDAEEAYRRFEVIGDHWIMGMSAQGVARQLVHRGLPGAEEWLRRSQHHLELVGADEDAQSVRILLDIRLALAGDEEAEQRLRHAPITGDRHYVGQALLGLAELELRRGHLDEARTSIEEAAGVAARPSLTIPELRVLYRAAAASMLLRLDDVPQAVALLRLGRTEALSMPDIPVQGAWTLAATELCAARGEVDRGRELWALASRLGTTLAYPFQEDLSAAFTEVFGPPEERIYPWRDAPTPAVTARIRELTGDL
jgi:predicted ATPase/DNA-binding SARP family transcriptional activator